ncbi:glutathionylspermidine synthase family protein [Polycladospora coralii]
MSRKSYTNNRKHIYDSIRQEGIFTWDTMYGEEYALASTYAISNAFRSEMAYATKQLGRIFHKTLQHVRLGSDQLLKELGLPRSTWPTIRLNFPYDAPTLIGRFDFAYTEQGLKMLEFNSDTPTGIVEAFYTNGKVCEALGKQDPNEKENLKIKAGFQRILSLYQKLGYNTKQIHFSSLNWHEEDKGTTLYLLRESGLSAVYTPLHQIGVKEDGVYAWDEQKLQEIEVNVWYRLHALEILAEDQDVDGYATGKHLLRLIADQKLGIINPPSGFIGQTKALQALIWMLHESNLFFTAEEKEIIQTYMLPTYLDNPFLKKEAYVRKPILGREGGAVTLFDDKGDLIDKDKEENYWDQAMIYQKYMPLQPIQTETLKGTYEGQLLWGSFLIDGEPSAIIARVDQGITSNLSHFLPIELKD